MESAFFNKLLTKAQKNLQKICFPETNAIRILQVAEQLIQLNAAIPVLIGKESEIRELAAEKQIKLDGAIFYDDSDEELIDTIVREYAKIDDYLSEKGLRRKLKSKGGIAAGLVKVGLADAFMSGFEGTTGETIFNARNIIGMQPGINTVSSLCILEAAGWEGPEGELLCLTDCVVATEPSPEGLADIAISACDTMKNMMDWEPRAAMLSYSTCGSGDTDNVLKVVRAVEIANEKRPDLAIDGEFQLDAALLPDVAKKKVHRESKVAGKANIIVFPDLNAGNIGVKLINLFGGYPVHGALIAGMKRPCGELSRSASLEQIVGGCIMLAVAAQGGTR